MNNEIREFEQSVLESLFNKDLDKFKQLLPQDDPEGSFTIGKDWYQVVIMFGSIDQFEFSMSWNSYKDDPMLFSILKDMVAFDRLDLFKHFTKNIYFHKYDGDKKAPYCPNEEYHNMDVNELVSFIAETKGREEYVSLFLEELSNQYPLAIEKNCYKILNSLLEAFRTHKTTFDYEKIFEIISKKETIKFLNNKKIINKLKYSQQLIEYKKMLKAAFNLGIESKLLKNIKFGSKEAKEEILPLLL